MGAPHNMALDHIPYLDIGSGYRRGDIACALNAYWSPLFWASLVRRSI
jgi:hypothetical protein